MSKTVWIISAAGRVEGREEAELHQEYADETTTPNGVGTRYHVRGCELWTWGAGGNFPHLVEAFDSEAEAEQALQDSFRFDFDRHPNAPTTYATEAAALRALAELKAD